VDDPKEWTDDLLESVYPPAGGVQCFDDFLYQAITENDNPWILNAGSNGAAIDPAINAQENGVLRVSAGSGDGTVAVDGSQFAGHIPVQADSGALVFETRLHINTAITNVSINAGLTDSTTLEEPFTIATATITSVASDAVCFVFDDGATTKEWYMCAVDSNTDDTGNAALGTAPAADTYQTLRIEVGSDGATARFYIDGTLAGTLSGAAGVSPNVNLYPTVIICGTGGTAATADVDYMYVGHTRS
jgi:hypothetical protein